MNKNRLETFSDGVLAIVITLLILDIRIPQVPASGLNAALHNVLPHILSYVISFAIIGVYWVGHHYHFSLVRKTNGVFTWLNMLLLLLISFIPFPTSLLGEYPFQTVPILIYGFDLLAVNIVSLAMFYYMYRHRELADPLLTKERLKEYMILFSITNALYVLAIIFALFMPLISYLLYILTICIVIILYATRGPLETKEERA